MPCSTLFHKYIYVKQDFWYLLEYNTWPILISHHLGMWQGQNWFWSLSPQPWLQPGCQVMAEVTWAIGVDEVAETEATEKWSQIF